MRIIFFRDDHLALEFGEILLHRVVHIHFLFVDEHHKRGGGDRLGHGGDPKKVVRGHGFLRGDIGIADRGEVEDLVLRCDERDRPGEHVGVDERLKLRSNGLGRLLRADGTGQRKQCDR